MKIFERITNDDFFMPLTSKYKQLNCDCMDALFKAAMEKSQLTAKEARVIIDDILADCQMDEEIRCNQYNVYDSLCKWGWIDDSMVGRGGKNVVVLNQDARQLITFLHKMAAGETGLKARDVYGIYDAAHGLVSGQGRSAWDCLADISERIVSLRDSLEGLKNNVRRTVADYVKERKTSELMKFFTDKGVEDLFEDYLHMKEDGFVMSFFDRAKGYLEEFEADIDKFDAAIKARACERDVDEAEAAEEIEERLRFFGYFLTRRYWELLAEIDREMSSCNAAINLQLALSLRFGDDNQDLIAGILDLLKEISPEAADSALENLIETLDFTHIEFCERGSYEPFRKPKQVGADSFIEESAISDVILEKKSQELVNAKENRLKRAREFVEAGMGEGSIYTPDRETVRSWDDALLVAELIAATGSGSEQFPYDISVTGETVETENARFTGIKIERRRL